MKTLNEIIESRNIHFINDSFDISPSLKLVENICSSFQVPKNFIFNTKQESDTFQEIFFKYSFENYLNNFCFKIKKEMKASISYFILYANYELVHKYNLLQLNSQNIKVMCHNNVKGNNMLLVPYYIDDNINNYLIGNIKLVNEKEVD